jgi:hypothetical protein
MKKLFSLTLSCAFLLAFFVSGVKAQEVQKPKGATAKKIMTNKVQKAKPVEMPQATSKRDQLSSHSAGYGGDEEGEPTQEWKPNTLDDKASKSINPLHDPVK